MDIQKYMESGILEEYCMGHLDENESALLFQSAMLYPEINKELRSIELTLEELAKSAAVEPRPTVKQRIMATLGFEENARLDISNLPAIDEHTNYEEWLNVLERLIPDEPSGDVFHLIRKDEQYQQMLVVTKNDVPEEEHGDLLESFFILKGRCECTVGNEIFNLSPGDFLQIPLHVTHNIKMLTPFVVGVLQYQYV